METNLLVIALRRANYAQLRTLRSRRQQFGRAWVDGWTSAFVDAAAVDAADNDGHDRAVCDCMDCVNYRRALDSHSDDRQGELFRPDGLASMPGFASAPCDVCGSSEPHDDDRCRRS